MRLDRSFLIALVAAGSLLTLFAFSASRWAASQAVASADVAAAQMARSQAGLLASELQRYRLLPIVLTEYPDVTAVLQGGGGETVARLNGKLELLADRTGAAAIYVIDRGGRTLAASNWRQPTSFVGQNYGFRPYFGGALRDGAAELFALGTVSGRPGLFIARRIEAGGRILGVIVVKVEFDALEAAWARQPGPTFVVDRHGVIIITSRPEWRFHRTRALDERAVEEIRRTLQFGDLPLQPVRLAADGPALREGEGRDSVRYRAAEVEAGLEGGALRHLLPLAPIEATAAGTARIATLTAFGLVVLAMIWLYRVREKRVMQAEARRALESEVAARTTELSEANRRLTEESQERERTDRRYRASREELAQANRLGSIGQITAGVAHEINQPVAAIRTFAENAGKFLDNGTPDRARANLDHIVALTERIGRITTELRSFARRGTPAREAVEVGPVIDAALLLIGDRVRALGVRIERRGEDGGIKVAADRVRLEQVLINLLQNALDALTGRGDPAIAISVERKKKDVEIVVADNGPGIADNVADSLFTPFVTGRVDGLGLGLGIARDIAREFGGDLELASNDERGAAFRVRLRQA